MRRALRVIAWNALLFLAGLALIAAAGESYLRLTRPFMTSDAVWRFVPEVGFLREPHTQARHTNRVDFWTVSRTNRLGFLDREPPDPRRADAACHVTLIGDSIVEAKEVPIAAKVHVQLEALAARALPRLDVTTSAFGKGGTGQVQQLSFYDAYVRHLRPELLVLVFVPNDFLNNSALLQALQGGWDPERLPEASAGLRPDGTRTLRPPRPDHARLPAPPGPQDSRITRIAKEASRRSWFAGWLEAKTRRWLPRPVQDPELVRRVDLLRRRPPYAGLLEGWRPTTRGAMTHTFARSRLPPAFEDALDSTAFALEQFKARADRDGAALVILASHRMKKMRPLGDRLFERMQAMADALEVPVIDQADYILRQGAGLADAQWRHDAHWNVAGHRWAAEALLEYLARHPELCEAG